MTTIETLIVEYNGLRERSNELCGNRTDEARRERRHIDMKQYAIAHELARLGQRVYTHTVSGCLADNDLRSHYELQDELREKCDESFLREVLFDSESGMFFCYATESAAEVVVALLDKLAPNMEVSTNTMTVAAAIDDGMVEGL